MKVTTKQMNIFVCSDSLLLACIVVQSITLLLLVANEMAEVKAFHGNLMLSRATFAVPEHEMISESVSGQSRGQRIGTNPAGDSCCSCCCLSAGLESLTRSGLSHSQSSPAQRHH